jgi:hypothetical protein
LSDSLTSVDPLRLVSFLLASVRFGSLWLVWFNSCFGSSDSLASAHAALGSKEGVTFLYSYWDLKER